MKEKAMISRWLLALVALWLGALASPSSAQAQSPAADGSAKKYRVVMQVSDPDPRGWNQTLNNALQLTRNAGKQNVEIEIVANGMGIAMLKEGSHSAELVAAALGQGIKVVACGVTMKALLLEKEDMLPDIVYVPGGLIEILDRQRDGWQYIKGG
jgi:intracellular sulfur oxidation DsrE/DsrF family protein